MENAVGRKLHRATYRPLASASVTAVAAAGTEAAGVGTAGTGAGLAGTVAAAFSLSAVVMGVATAVGFSLLMAVDTSTLGMDC